MDDRVTRILHDALCGEQLSAVTFVQDYYQFDFDGKRLTVHTTPRVDLPQRDVPNFRDRLCMLISQQVTVVEVLDQDAIRIEFGEAGTLIIPIDEASRQQVEAAYFVSNGRTLIVW